MWITNGSVSDIAIVWAKTEDGVVRGFIVEKDMKGFSAPIMKNKWSLRASVTSELILEAALTAFRENVFNFVLSCSAITKTVIILLLLHF